MSVTLGWNAMLGTLATGQKYLKYRVISGETYVEVRA
jgi:hypothetical protein